MLVADNPGNLDMASLELINKELTDRLTRQDQSHSRVETKLTLVIGFAATAAQFLATRHPFRTPWSTLFGLCAFGAYIGAFTVGLWGLRLSKYRELDAAELRQLAEVSQVEVLMQLIGTRRAAVQANKSRGISKVRSWWWSTGLLAAGLLASVVCIVQSG